MLETGSTAPDVELEDTAGNPVRLADYRGKRSVLMYFMRSVSCPVCNMHVKDLVRRSAELERDGVSVLIAVPERRPEAAAWAAKHPLPFLVVTGRSASPHETVGLTRKVFGSLQQSGSILIDLQGIIRHAHGAAMPTGGYDKKGIAEAIAATRTATLR